MISVFGSNLGEEEIREVTESIRNNWIGMGEKVARFEQRFAEYLKVDEVVMVNSGSNALYLAIHMLDLPPGSEIILPSFTWVACAHAVCLAGHNPVFCDVDPETQNISADTIHPHISPKTAAIMVVHYAGKPSDMSDILALGYPVIEDAAHALASRQNNRSCGSFGEAGIFSFDSIKNIACGEAGALIFRDPENARRARRLRYCGIEKSGFQQAQQAPSGRWWEYDISEIFIKMLPTDLSAGIGLAQLQKLPENQARRQKIWEAYQDAFRDHPQIRIPAEAGKDETHSYFTYLLRVPKRDLLAHYLFAEGIYTTLRYHPLHLNPIFGSDAVLPETEYLNLSGLNIPLHPALPDAAVEKVIDRILAFYRT
jgi:aminotransferase